MTQQTPQTDTSSSGSAGWQDTNDHQADGDKGWSDKSDDTDTSSKKD